jgi:predicted secreted protein
MASRIFWAVAGIVVALMAVQPAQAAKRVITEADQGAVIQLKPGNKVEVRLHANPTTGFRWVIDKGSAAPVMLLREWYSRPETNAMGAPGYQIFLFRATERGTGLLRLRYIRSWEPTDPNEKDVELQIEVK